MKQYLITCLLALTAVCVQAGLGLVQSPGLPGDGPVAARRDPPPLLGRDVGQVAEQ